MQLSEEEKKAIEDLKKLKDLEIYVTAQYFSSGKVTLDEKGKVAIDTILNLIEKQQKEIELKDKVIDLMIEDIKKADEFFNNQGFYSKFVNASKEYVLNSYINKVKGE